MKRAIAICLAVGLSACTIPAGTPPATASAAPAPTPALAVPAPPATGVIAKADSIVLSGERGFALAELSYTTAANGVARLVDAGLIRGETATRVRGWNSEARKLLVRGKAVTDGVEQARLAVQLLGLSDRINAITGAR